MLGQKLRYFGHIKRTRDTLEKANRPKPRKMKEGSRKRGRQRMRWLKYECMDVNEWNCEEQRRLEKTWPWHRQESTLADLMEHDADESILSWCWFETWLWPCRVIAVIHHWQRRWRCDRSTSRGSNGSKLLMGHIGHGSMGIDPPWTIKLFLDCWCSRENNEISSSLELENRYSNCGFAFYSVGNNVTLD